MTGIPGSIGAGCGRRERFGPSGWKRVSEEQGRRSWWTKGMKFGRRLRAGMGWLLLSAWRRRLGSGRGGGESGGDGRRRRRPEQRGGRGRWTSLHSLVVAAASTRHWI